MADKPVRKDLKDLYKQLGGKTHVKVPEIDERKNWKDRIVKEIKKEI